eukprot:TRINITY_DN5855_c1_g2_i1.p1 TRINITY_DN5855_c1_g2~~TRINITY_DN5855_c1_g2_i1.p1  ORF type:complete len:302 (-),score=62.91 TRINITY_DN5855_c1_g2_i1:484-1314(-)
MGSVDFDNFTNDSAMMIAWERALESKRADRLFDDPLAEKLAGTKGETLSEQFGVNMCKMFEFEDWPEFHKSWVAVRTRFIDDRIAEYAAQGNFLQLVNLGAGMDTRAYRMECYKTFSNGAFEVDMEVVNAGKSRIFSEFLDTPRSHCKVVNVDLDFLAEDKLPGTELGNPGVGFDATKPAIFVSEGLIMYLGAKGKRKFLEDVSNVAAPGSVLILQFLDASESAAAKASQILSAKGWIDFAFSKFGDDALNFGRFPRDRFAPSASFSFCTCGKASA